MKKGILCSFGFLFFVSVLISGCSKPEEKKAEAPPETKPTMEQTAPAVQQPAPAVQQPAPAVQEPAPAVQEPAAEMKAEEV